MTNFNDNSNCCYIFIVENIIIIMNQCLLQFFRIALHILVYAPILVIQPLNGQAPRREFRGVWVSTVANIDWPSKPGLNSLEQQQEIVEILERHRRNGINAIILQVRPSADAIYSSSLEPWSRYLTGAQGKAPDPFYDPLQYWIEEAHRRGMELHAWFNPYRIKLSLREELSEDHIIHAHPEWSFNYGSKAYFSPANPEVWGYLRSVVLDVVKRYDVDAIHFDDYFYPYQIRGEELPDSTDFAAYGGDFYPGQIDQWRRHNVDTVIQILSRTIKEEKPWVKFGISPFGVWRNRAEDPRGSETSAGTSNYDGLYADVIHWQREGWIDYLMPQLYWRDDHPAADFSTLAHWWNDFGYGRSMYVGLAPYRIDSKSEYRLWRKDKFFLQQIDIIRSCEGLDGFGFFSSHHFFREDLLSLNRKLQKKYCSTAALVPPMPWIDGEAPGAPFNLRVEGNALVWDVEEFENEMDRARFFVVYRYELNEERFLKKVENILMITGEKNLRFENGIRPGIFRVAALDRLNNESQLSQMLKVQ